MDMREIINGKSQNRKNHKNILTKISWLCKM